MQATSCWGDRKEEYSGQRYSSFRSPQQAVEEIEKKNISDQNIEFQNWAYQANEASLHDQRRIEAENQERIDLINEKIIEREQMLESMAGEDQAISQMKSLFRAQRKTEKRIRRMQE